MSNLRNMTLRINDEAFKSAIPVNEMFHVATFLRLREFGNEHADGYIKDTPFTIEEMIFSPALQGLTDDPLRDAIYLMDRIYSHHNNKEVGKALNDFAEFCKSFHDDSLIFEYTSESIQRKSYKKNSPAYNAVKSLKIAELSVTKDKFMHDYCDALKQLRLTLARELVNILG